jgi:hypothetical protein
VSSRKRRKEFNARWRKARKILRKAQTSRSFSEEEVALATAFKIDVLNGERVK